MLKDKKYNLYALIVSSIISIILFAYIELCLGFVECGGVYAIFLLLSGLSVTLATLLFFDGYIFILWLRHIFWGYVSLAFITVVLFNISKSYYDKIYYLYL